MAGHLKFCLTVMAGFVLFDESISVNQFLGLLLTLSGVIAYTHLRVGTLRTSLIASFYSPIVICR